MILCKITDKKDFMAKLLTGDSFDSFLLKEASIHSFVPYLIDGHINHAFFSDDSEDSAAFTAYEYEIGRASCRERVFRPV